MEQLIMDKDCSTTVSLNQMWWTEANTMYNSEEIISLIYIKVNQMFEHYKFLRHLLLCLTVITLDENGTMSSYIPDKVIPNSKDPKDAKREKKQRTFHVTDQKF